MEATRQPLTRRWPTLRRTLASLRLAADRPPSPKLTIDDLPDHVLEHVFVLAGQEYYPAIVGVSKRWGRVCWSSRQLWRRLDITRLQPGPLIARPTAATSTSPQPPAMEAGQVENARRQLYIARRRAAQLSLLQRVGHMAEAVALSFLAMEQLLSLDGLLSCLSPSTLCELSLHVGDITVEQAQVLTDFPELTCLRVTKWLGNFRSIAPILPRLSRLQHLELNEKWRDAHVAALLCLKGLTHLALTCEPYKRLVDLSDLRHLRQLRHLWLSMHGYSSHGSLQLPTPATFAALQSYVFRNVHTNPDLQLAGARFCDLTFVPLLQSGECCPSPPSITQGTVSLCGLREQLAAAGDGLVPAPQFPHQLSTLLAAALPPRASLCRLELTCSCIDAASLQQLPVLPHLQQLRLSKCRSAGSMDAVLQTLVQHAPVHTSLHFEAVLPGKERCSGYHLRSWPAYLLVHPSLRSANVFNREVAGWSETSIEALLRGAGSDQPVLEHLGTDCFPGVPPQLTAVTSLRSLAVGYPLRHQLTAGAVDTLLALPRLASLSIPHPSKAGQQAVERLRRARPELTIQVRKVFDMLFAGV